MHAFVVEATLENEPPKKRFTASKSKAKPKIDPERRAQLMLEACDVYPNLKEEKKEIPADVCL